MHYIAVVNMYGVLVVRSSLLAKWLREWVRVRVRLGAGGRECTISFLALQNVVNIFVFIGSVASYEYLIR